MIAAVSGGPDSLCLLDILHQLGYTIVVAHVNHRLRPEADAEAIRVRQHAASLNLPFVETEQDVLAYSQEHHLSVEEAARDVRYRFLFEQARSWQAQAVATGHTANDQVETFLMHLFRGAGLSGLRGMEYHSLPNAWSIEIPLIRPLLSVWREQILDYIEQHQLLPSLDLSNLDQRYTRNRIRLEVLPYLESIYPGLSQRLWQTTQLLTEDHNLIEEINHKAWQNCLLLEGDQFLAFDFQAIRSQPPVIQRWLLRQAIYHIHPGLRDVDYRTLQRAQAFINKPARTHLSDLMGGLYLLADGDHLWLADWRAELPASNGLPFPTLSADLILDLPVPGVLALSSSWSIKVEKLSNLEQALVQAEANQDPFQAWLDVSHLQSHLQVRTRRPGDTIKPLGMGGQTMKLSDLMVNSHLPARARSNWPVVVSGDQIVWVPGYRMADFMRLTSTSQEGLHLQMLFG